MHESAETLTREVILRLFRRLLTPSFWRHTLDPDVRRRRMRILLPLAILAALVALGVMIADVLGYL